MATVLVVDDDPTNREFLRTLLVYRGHRVREAADGDSALSLAGREPPDAVITDVLMPGLDGYELARQLRSQPLTSRIPIAFSTAHYGQAEIEPLARACGVQNVILKPAQPKAVLAVIDALLGAGPFDSLGSSEEFADQHRMALKTKLLETTNALRAADDRATYLAERLAETQRVTNAGTWDLDPRSGVVVLSTHLRDLLRLPTSNVLQQRLWRRVHPDDVERLAAVARHTLRTGRPHVVELRVADRDGVVRHLVVSCRVAKFGARRLLWGVTHDVSSAHDAQLQAQMTTDESTERRVLDRVHEAMLPGTLPTVPGVDLAAAYVTAADRLDTGGSWYDAIPVAGGRILLTVGSVAGQDCHAVAAMGQVRAALRAYAIESADPPELLARLNRFLLASSDDNRYVTAAVVLCDPVECDVRISNAGHPAPLVLAASGAGRLPSSDPALGIFRDVEFAEQRLTFRPGTTLCVYTGGLTDCAGAPDAGRRLTELAAAVYQRTPDAQRLVAGILGGVLGGSAPDDDVCLAALRVV